MSRMTRRERILAAGAVLLAAGAAAASVMNLHAIAAYGAGVAALLTAGRRQLSLVDCVSFLTMRRLNLKMAFAFDRHFTEQGFEVLA